MKKIFFNKNKDNLPPHLQWFLRGETLFLEGELTLKTVNEYQSRLVTEIKKYSRPHLTVDLSQLSRIDSSGVVFLKLLPDLTMKFVQIHLQNTPSHIAQVIHAFQIDQGLPTEKHPRFHFLANIGEKVYNFFWEDIPQFFYLMSDIFYWTFADLFNHKHRRKGEFFNQSVLIGTNALPIVCLIALLIGLILALQSAAQLRQFGANIYVVDLIVISMTREMGPLLTAIMLAGRSGSSIASEIATMVVTEEIDALKTMALNPVRFVVVPKMYAMLVSLPILAFIANIAGILGRMIIANFYLDINVAVFFSRMENVLLFRDLLTGFIKSLVFAGLIVISGSFFGFRVKGGAEGVGRVTTASVVSSIFLVILADSILGLIFYFD